MITTLTARAQHPLRKKHLAIIGAVAAVVLLAFLIGYLPRHRAHSELVAQTSAQQGPLRVSVVSAVAAPSGRELTLPATLAPFQRTLVFARASGFVRRWLVDIGSRVHKGDLLVELETPELTQQLEQAKATLLQREAALAQARANLDFAKITAQRMHTLFQEALVAKQDDDQARTQASVWEANVKAALADIEAMRANIRQLEQLISFGKVLAPYDGTITQRLVDVGTLVNAGAGTNGAALFEIEATNPIRAFIDVPQPFAPSVRTGMDAYVSVRQFPGRKFPGKVARTAGAIDPARSICPTTRVSFLRARTARPRSGSIFPIRSCACPRAPSYRMRAASTSRWSSPMDGCASPRCSWESTTAQPSTWSAG